MATNFPSSLDSLADVVDNVDSVLASHHNNNADAIEAIEAKIGVDSSAVTSSHDYKLRNLPAQDGTTKVTNLNADLLDSKDGSAYLCQTSQAVGSTADPSITSTSYVDLEEMSITITTGANPVYISFSGVFDNSGGDQVSIIIDIDGADQTQSGRIAKIGSGEYQVMATSWLKTMTAASHTFKIQWRVNASTGRATSTNRAMQVIEFKS